MTFCYKTKTFIMATSTSDSNCTSENCRCSECVNTMSPKQLFTEIVHDALTSRIFTKCWNHEVKVDIKNFTDETDEKQLLMLKELTRFLMHEYTMQNTRELSQPFTLPPVIMTIQTLVKYVITAFFHCFKDDNSVTVKEANINVANFMWTAIGKVNPWSTFVVVNAQ